MAKIDREQLEERLTAYLDGELDEEQATAVERWVAEDPHARQLLNDLRQAALAVSLLPRHGAPESIAEEVRAQLERGDLLGLVDQPQVFERPRRRIGWGRFATAAALGFIMVGGVWAVIDQHRSTDPHGATQFALQDKEETLDVAMEVAPSPRGERGTKSRAKGHAADTDADRSDTNAKLARRSTPKRNARNAIASIEKGSRGDAAASRAGRWTTVLTIDQKLASHEGAQSLRDHSFDNERIRLRVQVPDDRARELAEERLLSYLAERNVGALTDKRDVDGAACFYHAGRAGVNHAGGDDRQILIHASAAQLDGLVARLAVAESDPEDVVLTVADLPFAGSSQAGEMLARLGRPVVVAEASAPHEHEDATDMALAPGDESPSSLPPPDVDLLAELMRSVGLDLDSFELTPPPGRLGELADASAPRDEAPASEGIEGPPVDESPDAAAGVAQADSDGEPSDAAAPQGGATFAEGTTEEPAIRTAEAKDASPTVADEDAGLPETVPLVDRRMKGIAQTKRPVPDTSPMPGGVPIGPRVVTPSEGFAETNAEAERSARPLTIVVELVVKRSKPAAVPSKPRTPITQPEVKPTPPADKPTPSAGKPNEKRGTSRRGPRDKETDPDRQ